MKKDIKTRVLGIFVAMSLSCGLVGSASAIDMVPDASYYLSSYAVSAGTYTNCHVVISFDVHATRIMDLVGASYLVIQEYDNGVWTGVHSYFGSTDNGMLEANSSICVGSVTYIGNTGSQYRGIVTVYAGDASGEDSRTITTNIVTAQ